MAKIEDGWLKIEPGERVHIRLLPDPGFQFVMEGNCLSQRKIGPDGKRVCPLCKHDASLPEPCPSHRADCPYVYS